MMAIKFSSTETASYTGVHWTLNIDQYIVSICSLHNVHGLDIKIIVARISNQRHVRYFLL